MLVSSGLGSRRCLVKLDVNYYLGCYSVYDWVGYQYVRLSNLVGVVLSNAVLIGSLDSSHSNAVVTL